jgi:hypothetical protein
VPAPVLVAARADVYDVQFFVLEHLAQVIVRLDAVLLCCVIGPFLDNVTDRYQLGQGVRYVAVCVAIPDAAQTYNTNL